MTKKNTFLDSELNTNERSQEYSKFHILPVPLEKTVSYGLGTSKGPEAIILASNELERYTGKSEPCLNGIFTHPFINCEQSLSLIMDDIRTTTKKISSKNKIPVTIGGEHSLTYGAVNGIYEGLNLLNKKYIAFKHIKNQTKRKQHDTKLFAKSTNNHYKTYSTKNHTPQPTQPFPTNNATPSTNSTNIPLQTKPTQ